MAIIVTGDDVSIPTTLKKDGATFVINPVATVTAGVVSQDRSTVLIPSTVVDVNAVGGDWSVSLVIVEFTSALTGAVTSYGDAILEIQVDDNGKTTWFGDIRIIKGSL